MFHKKLLTKFKNLWPYIVKIVGVKWLALLANLSFTFFITYIVVSSFETIVVTSGAWKATVGMVKEVNKQKQTLTINVELFGRETPVEIQFSEVKKM